MVRKDSLFGFAGHVRDGGCVGKLNSSWCEGNSNP